MQTSLTDEETIRRYLTSHPSRCFETLYSRYVCKVYQTCLSMTKDTDVAEDFTHDIFLKVFAKLNAFQERSSFSTWLYAIAFNYCSDQLRKSKRYSWITLDESILNTPADSSQEAQLREESIRLVNLALASLSPTEQAMLRLKYEQGRSVSDIAQLYALKPSAVKMRLKRSREKIYRLHAKLNHL